MTDISKNQNLTPYQQLPEGIQEWFVSDQVYLAFLEIEKRVNAAPDKIRVIPDLVHDLVTGVVSPKDAAQKIKEGFSIPEGEAVAVTTILKERVLNPVLEPLKLIAKIDLSVLPGKNPEPAAKKAEVLEPLIATPQSAKLPAQPGMALPPIRSKPQPQKINDISAPKTSPEPAKPVQAPKVAPKVTEAPRPFMLHEEKPIAPTQPSVPRVEKTFSFDIGPTPMSRQPIKPVAAQLNSSFDSMLEQKKPAAPVTAKTTEEAKVVHYTSFKTPLDETGAPRK